MRCSWVSSMLAVNKARLPCINMTADAPTHTGKYCTHSLREGVAQLLLMRERIVACASWHHLKLDLLSLLVPCETASQAYCACNMAERCCCTRFHMHQYCCRCIILAGLFWHSADVHAAVTAPTVWVVSACNRLSISTKKTTPGCCVPPSRTFPHQQHSFFLKRQQQLHRCQLEVSVFTSA